MKMRSYQLEAKQAAIREWASHQSTLIQLPTGCGKCLGKGTPVLMFDGRIVPVEDIVPGDLLMGPDSKPRTVISTTAGVETMYRVTPVKGDGYTVNESHILSLKLTPDRPNAAHELVNISVRDYLRQNNTFRHRAKGWRSAVEWPSRPVPLHPYLLGLWLGDGSTRAPAISKPDPEIEVAVRQFAADYGLRFVQREVGDGKCPTMSMSGPGKKPNPVYASLLSLGVIPNRHVPLCYRANDRSIRLETLAGLLDSDGHLVRGGFDFISKHQRLSEDVAFLCRSLGIAAYIKECRKNCQNGFNGTYWRVGISGDCTAIPMRIHRKQPAERKQIKSVLVTGISVEPVGPGDYYGFELDGDGLFMLGDFTVTHNTIVFAAVVADAPSRSIVMAHTDDLVQEAARKISKVTDCTVAIEMGESKSDERHDPAKVIVTSVQSMSRDSRLARFDPSRFSRLIIDEGHHALGKSYRKVQAHFQQNPDLRTLLTTATPKRTDKKALSQVCDSVAYQMSIEDAIDQGWLVYPEARSVTIDGLDFSALRTVGGDFSLDELEALLTAAGPLQGMAKATLDMAGQDPTIVFCCTVKHAYLASEILNSYRGGSATFLAGEKSYSQLQLEAVSKEERRKVLDRYRGRGVQFLCLCQLGLEGFDAPCTVNVAMWRATQSLTVYTQAFGRGTRPAEDIADRLGDYPEAADRVRLIRESSKPVMRMLDFKGNAGQHQICDLTDLLGGSYGFPVRAHARKILDEEGKSMRPDDLLERSAAEVAWLEYVSAERAKREALARTVAVDYRVEAVDPFGRSASVPLADNRPAREPATDKQVWKLVRLGVAEELARTYSKKQAGVVIGKMSSKQGAA